MPKKKTIYELTIALNPSVGEYDIKGNLLKKGEADRTFALGIATARKVLRSNVFEGVFQGFDLRGSNEGPMLRAYFSSQKRGNREIIQKVEGMLAERFRGLLGIPYGDVSVAKLTRGSMAEDPRRRSSLLKVDRLDDRVAVQQQLPVEEEEWKGEYDSALPELEMA